MSNTLIVARFYRLIPGIHRRGVVALMLFVAAQLAAQSQPTPAQLQQRIEKLETENTETVRALSADIDSLKALNDAHRSFMTNFGGAFVGLISVLIAIQGLSAWSQTKREKESREQQRHRQSARDLTDKDGALQVREILSTVKGTLDTRLTAEREALERARKAERKYENLQNRFSALEQFVDKFQATIAGTRTNIEAQAKDIATRHARHDFRTRAPMLAGFAGRYDRFQSDYEPLEVPTQAFTSRAQYIRGIAAHYANQPETARTLLEMASTNSQGEPDETNTTARKRAGIAQYYLGVLYSNFGDYENALANLSRSIEDDPKNKDFLSRVVYAETRALAGEYEDAEKLLKDLITRIIEKEQAEKALPESERRLRSRASLVQVNMLLKTQSDGWRQTSLRNLGEIRAGDAHYYYAIFTQAQLYDKMQDTNSAKVAFADAYIEIRSTGDLITVHEARSRILLLLVAGVCAKHGLNDDSRAKEHFDEAQACLLDLPTLDGKVCRVFSPLSKLNETRETIEQHIKLIRGGTVLWVDANGV